MVKSERSFGGELHSWEQAEMLFQQVRDLMSQQYDAELPKPDLVRTPDRADSFMCAIPPHAPIEFFFAHDPIHQILQGPNRFGKVGDNSVILYNDPQKTDGTRRTSDYATGFAHEIGHCALYTHNELTSGTRESYFVQSSDPLSVLHEGIATVFERDFSTYLLTDDNARRYGVGNFEKIMRKVSRRIGELCPIRISASARFNNNSYKTVVGIMGNLGLRMAEVLKNPNLVYDQIQKINQE